MPPPIIRSQGPAQEQPGTIWWRHNGSGDVCIILSLDRYLTAPTLEQDIGRAQVQFLNNRQCKKYFFLSQFRLKWSFQPRVNPARLNAGSIWQRINYVDQHGNATKVDRRQYVLSRIVNNKVVLHIGRPEHYKEVDWGVSIFIQKFCTTVAQERVLSNTLSSDHLG